MTSSLVDKIKNYDTFPNHYIHCCFSLHVYLYSGETAAENNEIDKEATESLKKHFEKVHNIYGWEVKRVFNEKTEYTKTISARSILYINKKKKQLILAYRGVQLSIRDFFFKDQNQISPTVYSMMTNLEIAEQTYFAFKCTKDCLKILYEQYGDEYSLSFTGYSFGAWLAEQSVFFSHKSSHYDSKRQIQDFPKYDVRAVTFDSPGSKEYLEMLNESNILSRKIPQTNLIEFDIISYLSAPNFVNTSNVHVANEIYIIKLENENKENENMVNFIRKEFIEEIPESIHTCCCFGKPLKHRVEHWHESLVATNMNRYYFYLYGIKQL